MGCKNSKGQAVVAEAPPHWQQTKSTSRSGTLLERKGTSMSLKSSRSSRSASKLVALLEQRLAEIEKESQSLLMEHRSRALTAMDLGPATALPQEVVEQKVAAKTAQYAVAAVECAATSSRAAAWAACDAAWAAFGGGKRAVEVTESMPAAPASTAAPPRPALAPAEAAGAAAGGAEAAEGAQERVLVDADALFGPLPADEDAEPAARADAKAAEVEVMERKSAPAGEQEWCFSRMLQESNPLAAWASSFVACRPACRDDAEKTDDVVIVGRTIW